MPRWLRMIRAMVGTGLTFAIGVGGVATLVGGVATLLGNTTIIGVMRLAGRLSVVSFLLGVAFSGLLAVISRSRFFSTLSLRFGALLGAGTGTLYWLFLAMTGGRVWTLRTAMLNFVLLNVMGAGSALATLWIARRAGAALRPGDAEESLGAGNAETVNARSRSKVEAP